MNDIIHYKPADIKTPTAERSIRKVPPLPHLKK